MKVWVKTWEEMTKFPGVIVTTDAIRLGDERNQFADSMIKYCGSPIEVEPGEYGKYSYKITNTYYLAEWMVNGKEDMFNKLYLTLKG